MKKSQSKIKKQSNKNKISSALIAVVLVFASIGGVLLYRANAASTVQQLLSENSNGSCSKVVTVRKGDKGGCVVALQNLLNKYAFCANIKAIGNDGDFGDQTFNRLVLFQSRSKITADGVAGNQTWGAFMKGVCTNNNKADDKVQNVVNSGMTPIGAELNAAPNPNVQRSPAPTKCSYARPGAVAIWRYGQKHFGAKGLPTYGVYNCRSKTTGSTLSLHADGRAVDFGFNWYNSAERARGDLMFVWLINNAEHLGVQYVKWNDQQWSSATGMAEVRSQSDIENHRTHIHIELNQQSAYNKQTKFFTSGAVNDAPAVK